MQQHDGQGGVIRRAASRWVEYACPPLQTCKRPKEVWRSEDKYNVKSGHPMATAQKKKKKNYTT